ncbi:MAG: hypothetical protein AB7V27_05490 [Candidatus Binatia bacterium]
MRGIARWAVVLVIALLFARPSLGATLKGELVPIDGQRFRLVGQHGVFKAPPGMSPAALDGKLVEVEVGPDGRVASITPLRVPIVPRVSGFEKMRGVLVVQNPAARTFTFAGDTEVYAAPPTIDITPYAGKVVEATFDANGQVVSLAVVPVASAGAAF